MTTAITTAEGIDAFTQALREQSNEALYNIGITVDITELPIYDYYAYLENWIFCPRWLLCLRRRFQPRKYSTYTREYIDASLRLQKEFIEVLTNDNIGT